MKIALIGYGKMGKAIERIALQRGHEIVLKIDLDNAADLTRENLSIADVAIEFTGPASAVSNLMKCADAGIATVCGSTGWLESYTAIQNTFKKNGSAFLYASNFSVGVNIFFELNKALARLMSAHPEYRVQMKEIHHTQKKDAPSGTAITLAEQIQTEIPQLRAWVNKNMGGPEQLSFKPDELPIFSERIDPAPGTHEVKYYSDIDDIEIIHTAHSREGFAGGAVRAAEFIRDKKGIFTMREVLGF